MSPEMLSSLLWTPFVLTALIAGLIYCISGYRRGLWQALVSLGAMVLATVLSVLASRLVAGWIAPGLVELIPAQGADELSASMLRVILSGAVSVALAMLLFGVLMLIFTPILSGICRRLLGKHLETEDKGLKWLGMVTGLLTAVVFSLFWLSPIYGTLATAAPMVQTVVEISKTEEEDLAQVNAYVDSMSRHLLVQASGTGPVSAVYDGLSGVSVGGASVSVVDMSEAAEEMMALMEQLMQADSPEMLAQLGGQMLDTVRSHFVEQDWFYELYRGITQTVRDLAADSRMEDIEYVHRLLELADMSREEFKDLCGQLLDFGRFLLDKGVLTFTEETDPMQVLDSGILEEMGKVLNSSHRMAEVKKLALGLMLEECGLTFGEAMSLMEKYQVGQLTDPALQRQEVEALLLPGMSRDIPPVVTVLRHPSLGEAALADVQALVSFQQLMGLPEELEVTEKEQTRLLEAVKQAATLPFAELAQLETGLGAYRNMLPSNEAEYAQ